MNAAIIVSRVLKESRFISSLMGMATDEIFPRLVKEIEVLEQVAAGNSNRVVAQHLEISEDTVKSHIRSILNKLEANDRTHAVTIALRRGFLDM